MASRTGKASVLELVEEHMALVPFFLGQSGMRWYADREDLMQAGYEAMIIAAQKFEPERGNTFGTYAKAWIRQAFQREAWRAQNPRMSERKTMMARGRLMHVAEMEQKLGREPTIEELVDALGTEMAEAPPLPETYSYDGQHSPVGEDDDWVGAWLTEEDPGFDLVEELEALDYLAEEQRAILIAVGMGYTNKEIAEAMDYHPVTVSKKLKEARYALEAHSNE
jgi:RNA polymerase sigma factor (sigma-70 family)